MSKQLIYWIFITSFFCGLLFGEAEKPLLDRIEVRGGVVLTGTILESKDEVIRLKTDYAGVLEVQIGMVQKIVSSRKLPDSIPASMVVAPKAPVAQAKQPAATQKESQPPAKVAQKPTQPAQTAAKPPAKTPVAAKTPAKALAKPPAKKPAPAKKYGWELEAGLNLAGSSGNTDKLDFGFTIDSKYLQKFYRIDLYGRYAYGENRGKQTSNESILGARYTNFFYKRFGFFLREELEHDEFELIDIRTTSATGFSYKIFDEKTLDLEARSGLSYRYEVEFDGEEEDYPGMDFGIDFSWQYSPYLSFKGKYGFIPSFNSSDEFIVTQNTAIDIPLSKSSKWKIRLGLTSKYNNQPSKKRKKMDNKYYVRLMASWK